MFASPDSHYSSLRCRKTKARFTFTEVHILLNEVRKNRHIVVGKFNRGVPTEVKKRAWAAITACLNETGECHREVIDVIKKWSDLKSETECKVAAIQAGKLPYKGMNAYLSCDLSPIENIVHQILELDGKRGRLPTSVRNVYSGTGLGDDEEEEDAVLGIPSSSTDNPNNGDTSHPSFETQNEVSYEDQELQLVASDENYYERSPPPVLPAPNPPEDEHFPASFPHVTSSAVASHATSSSEAWKPSQAAPSVQEKIVHCTSLSIQEQHNTNILLETVSRSLELLSESVQQLAETQQEFVHHTLQLQRETVHILHDFASGALALMHDTLNERPAL